MRHGSHGEPAFETCYAESERQLGRGTFGEVREARDAQDGKVVVKRFFETHCTRAEVERTGKANAAFQS